MHNSKIKCVRLGNTVTYNTSNLGQPLPSSPIGDALIHHHHMCVLSHVALFAALRTVDYQAPLLMEFSRQEYWSGLPFLPPGDLPDPEIKQTSPVSPAL